jgi:hypothetical protein
VRSDSRLEIAAVCEEPISLMGIVSEIGSL